LKVMAIECVQHAECRQDAEEFEAPGAIGAAFVPVRSQPSHLYAGIGGRDVDNLEACICVECGKLPHQSGALQPERYREQTWELDAQLARSRLGSRYMRWAVAYPPLAGHKRISF